MTHKRRSKPKTKVEVKKRRRAVEACAPEGANPIPTVTEVVEHLTPDYAPTGIIATPAEAPIRVPDDILEDRLNRLHDAMQDNPSRMWMVWAALGAVVIGAILWAFGLL